MNRTTAVLAFGFLLCLVSLARAQETYTLKRVFKQGETDRYTTVIKFEQNATEAVMVTTDVTREVKEDGTAVVATTVDSLVLRARGAEMPFPGGSGQVVFTTYDANGKLVKQDSIGGGGVNQLLNIARPSVVVQRPMKVGETVKEEVPIGPDKTLKAVVTITFQGVDKKGAEFPEDCLRYKVVTESPVLGAPSNVKNKSEMTVRMLLSSGKLFSAEGTMEGIPIPTGGTTRITYKVTRTEPQGASSERSKQPK